MFWWNRQTLLGVGIFKNTYHDSILNPILELISLWEGGLYKAELESAAETNYDLDEEELKKYLDVVVREDKKGERTPDF